MNEHHSQPNDLPEESFSLEDPALKKIESQLAERLVARPALIDRGALLNEASWRAGCAAAQREISSEGSSAGPVEEPGTLEKSNQRLRLNTLIVSATGGALAIACLLALVILPQLRQTLEDEEKASQQASMPTPSQSMENVPSQPNEADRLPIASNDSGQNAISRSVDLRTTNQPKRAKRPLFLAGIGTFSAENLDSLTESKPIRSEEAYESSDDATDEFDPKAPTAFNLMREWLIRTEKIKPDSSED